MWGVCLTHPVLASSLCKEFLLQIPWWLRFCIWGLSVTHPVLVSFFSFFIGRVSLTHPLLASFLSWEFLLHFPCWHHFYLGSFCYTSGAGFIFVCGISLTHPVLVLILSGMFLLHIPCCRHFLWGVSLTQPMLAWFFCGEFLLHTPCLLHIYGRILCYTFRTGFIFISDICHADFVFMWDVSLRHPVLAYFLLIFILIF